MRAMTLEEVKQCELTLLCLINKVCEENKLHYSLTGGTLIGAIRHQGFIPWDDDIDIMMPRPDYDRFLEIVREGDYGFDLRCRESDGTAYGYPFAKACCRGTLLKEKAVKETQIPLGVYVDIFPVDGAGNSHIGAKLRAMVFVALHGLRITANWTHYRRSKLRKWYYEPLRYVCYLLSKLFGCRLIDAVVEKFLRRKNFSDCAYAGRLVGDYGVKEVMPKAWFLHHTEVVFEGKTFPAIAEYDAFLKALYGDYMQLPPKEKQVTHHEFEAYWVK